MTPPTATDDLQGKVIDGAARAPQWRRTPAPVRGGPSAEGSQEQSAGGYLDPLRSPGQRVAIPVGLLGPEAPGRSEDPYMDQLRERGAAEGPQAGEEELVSDTAPRAPASQEIDEFFAERASTPPRPGGGASLAPGSAGLPAPPRGRQARERARPTGALSSRPGVGARKGPRALVLGAATVLVVAIAAIALNSSGASQPASASAVRGSDFLDTFTSKFDQSAQLAGRALSSMRLSATRPRPRSDVRKPRLRPRSVHQAAAHAPAPSSSAPPSAASSSHGSGSTSSPTPSPRYSAPDPPPVSSPPIYSPPPAPVYAPPRSEGGGSSSNGHQPVFGPGGALGPGHCSGC